MQEEPPTPVPKAPAGLKTAGKRFWKQVHHVYEFDGSPEVVLLVEEAARTADVVARLQHIVDTADSLRTTGSRNQDVAIPELDALRQSKPSTGPATAGSSGEICRCHLPRGRAPPPASHR
jgi:hypothetical protein